MKRALLFIVCGFGLVRCGGSNSAGPCEHTYEDPVIHIVSVASTTTHLPVPGFKIAEVFRDNAQRTASALRSVSYNVAAYDSILYCNAPCGFGFETGNYRFKVSAQGYRDTVIAVTANYAITMAGCPSSSSGGTEMSIALQPG